jgi:hypothetical protein
LVLLDVIGDGILLRRFEVDEAAVRRVQGKLRKAGLTKRRAMDIVDKERTKLWKERAHSFR